MTGTLDFQIRRDDFRTTRWTTATKPPLAVGEVRLSVDRFAFSANNITYAVTGNALGYWSFFPAPDGWGRLPAFGFADVAESRAEGVVVGERFFGYLPMSSDIVVRPSQVGPAGFVEASPHRANLPVFYNEYVRADAKAGFAREREGIHALLWPLFLTGFLIDDFLAEHGFFGARTVMIASASSKTALALAFALARRKGEVQVIGLTSPANHAFVRRREIHDDVVLYDEIARMPVEPSVLVDMSGSWPVRQAVHERFKDNLKYDCAAGRTHWEAGGRPGDLPGPAPKLFFAPDAGQRRILEWGPGELEARSEAAWRAFLGDAARWLELHEGSGTEAVEAAYRTVLEGRSTPEQGHVLSLTCGSAEPGIGLHGSRCSA
jgi:hypothetical protein